MKKWYPLHGIIIFEPKSSVLRERQVQLTKYSTCGLLATLTILGRNFLMSGICILRPVHARKNKTASRKQKMFLEDFKNIFLLSRRWFCVFNICSVGLNASYFEDVEFAFRKQKSFCCFSVWSAMRHATCDMRHATSTQNVSTVMFPCLRRSLKSFLKNSENGTFVWMG